MVPAVMLTEVSLAMPSQAFPERFMTMDPPLMVSAPPALMALVLAPLAVTLMLPFDMVNTPLALTPLTSAAVDTTLMEPPCIVMAPAQSMPSEPELRMLMVPDIMLIEPQLMPSDAAFVTFNVPDEMVRLPITSMPCLVLPVMFSMPVPEVTSTDPALWKTPVLTPPAASAMVELPLSISEEETSEVMSMAAPLGFVRVRPERTIVKLLLLLMANDPSEEVPEMT